VTDTASPQVLVVGAGPAALSIATVLACQEVPTELEVVDPSGTWLTAWHRRFAAQDIPHLRSPAVHHPHPDPFALLAVTPRDELTPSGGTSLPSTASFARFCDDLVHRQRLQDAVTPTRATGLEVDAEGRPTVHLADGSLRRPDRVVLATNARRPGVPAAVHELVGRDPRVRCGDAATLADTPVGGHVVVVGGGLSAAHLAVGAAERGATVTLLTRRHLRVRRFDTHPSWLGPRKRRPFEAEPDPHVRRRTIDDARGGGSIPHRMRRRIEDGEARGVLELRCRVTLTSVDARDDHLHVRTSDGGVVRADALWLATGGAVDVTTDPLCRPLHLAGRATVAGGMPDLDPDLSWPGTRVHLVGAAASLALGPTAGNLVGQRRAALRLAAVLRGDDPIGADRIATGAGACTSGQLRVHGASMGPGRGSRPAEETDRDA
jgi:cation diffusion facilitator CzcD-associated flavoprotein CzcO